MSNSSLVITGISTVSSLGIGFNTLAKGLDSPVVLSNLKSFDFHEFDRNIPCYRIPDFDPKAILGKKGLRTKDSATKILLAALEIGFKEMYETLTEENKPGIVIGTSFGSIQSIGDFLSDSIVNGVNAVNPMAFANTVINSPTGNANIRYTVKSLSTTISTGFNSGIDAILYACDYLKRGYEPILLAGGLEELSYYSLLGLDITGLLSRSKTMRPFDKKADGTVMGEGCALFSIESEENAQKQGKKIIAEIVGYCNAFDPGNGKPGFNPKGEGARYTIEQALIHADLSPKEIDFIAASGNGDIHGDEMESSVIQSIFNDTPVATYKHKTGECYGSSAPLSLACAISDSKNNRITGTDNAYDIRNNINLCSETITGYTSTFILLTSFSCDGYCSSLIIKNRH